MKKKHYCEECGSILSEYEIEEYGDLCEDCCNSLVE